MNNEMLEAQIEEIIKMKLGERLPHTCMTCALFQFNTEAKKGVARNRYCQYHGEIKLVKGVCQMWSLADDLACRQPRNITV